ncbi:DUF4123 domain-containing protein [Vreelandella zhanjiangensis]|uniref:DUF4123 domain-containing protein n=1 Tax=Vreelandella zhanjiangensis TaxID=1121960 RepID=UPI000368540E|nr:DUF4123 domain-containing protein [Halomonas zhanjiangensis]
MRTFSTATHALIDGVRYPDALKRLYRRDDVEEIEPLYLATRWSDLAEHGPIVVKLKRQGLLSEANDSQDNTLYRALSFINSQADTGQLSRHFRRFITFKGAAGQEQLLRFADPLVTRLWLESYAGALLPSLMGPITTWWVAHWSPNWREQRTFSWQAFQRSDDSSSGNARVVSNSAQAPDFLPMAHAQYDALEAVAHWQLKERLTDYFNEHARTAWHALPAQYRGQWLDARLAQAKAWGANTHRQLAIWVDLSLHWGNDFSTASDGLYHRWREHAAGGTHLSAQEQLYAMDRWSRTPAADSVPSTSHHTAATQTPPINNEAAHG